MPPIQVLISAGASTRNVGQSPHHLYTSVLVLFSLTWYSASIRPLTSWVYPLPLYKQDQTSTDCQGSLAPKGKENTRSRSGDRRGARKGLWPPMEDGFSSIVKNKWPTEVNCLWLSKKVLKRQWFSKFSMCKNHLGNSLNMQNPGPYLQIFSINNSDGFVPWTTPCETLSEKAKKTWLDTNTWGRRHCQLGFSSRARPLSFLRGKLKWKK